MSADDVVAKTIPEIGVVVLTGQAPALGPTNIVPVVNQLVLQFDQLGIQDRVKEAGPRIIFYEFEQGDGVTVALALPVAEPPAGLPAPARFRVLPEIEAAVAVRSGPAPAAKSGYTTKTTRPTPACRYSRSSCRSPGRRTDR
jgi:hypothetical protein